jgi:hypothetical protein
MEPTRQQLFAEKWPRFLQLVEDIECEAVIPEMLLDPAEAYDFIAAEMVDFDTSFIKQLPTATRDQVIERIEQTFAPRWVVAGIRKCTDEQLDKFKRYICFFWEVLVGDE